MTLSDRKTGTREWSDHSVNCCLGCRHGCLYCYARQAALRWGKIDCGEDWTNERPDADAATVRQPTHKGIVMFPTCHDITVGNVGACLSMLVHLLHAENHVLVVSKAGPHVPRLLDTARALVGKGSPELRVSLTCLDERLAAFWEPGAPPPDLRLDALRAAFSRGLATSVSIEPLLEPARAYQIVAEAVLAGVDGEIWIGAANHLRARTAWVRNRLGSNLEAEICRIESGQTPEKMHDVWEALRGKPQIRWKDSYQKVLGIDAMGRPAAGPKGDELCQNQR
jgi:DNA repair photolyase